MPSYRVSFINKIPRNEKLFRCCQRVIIIRSARTPERAVEAAKKRFARLEGIRDWGIHASQIEIETIEGTLELPGATPPLRKTCPSHKGELRLLGIFTGRDAVHRVLAEGKSAARTTLADVMTPDPDTMPPGKMAIEALRLMEDGCYRHLPIVDEGRVVGIVSRFDISGIELDRLDEETGLWERI